MAEGLFNPETIAEAEEGFREFSRRFGELAGEEPDPKDSIVRFLRGIPADDKSKKRELSKYFQTEDGQRYTREERKAAYDELLGVNRNRETIG